jgi:hypothetical protein
MEKEWAISFFLGMMILVIMLPTIHAADVCGAPWPGNSSQGKGMAIICNHFYPCNVSDGVCPEDFVDSAGFRANCENCSDIDCTLKISGYVTDTSGTALPGANVSVQLSAFKPSTLANAIGFYSLNIQPGKYPITTTKDGFDTAIYENTFSRGNIYEHNFTLPLGVCNPDCTNSFNRCSAQCDGITFNYSQDTKCEFPSASAKAICNDKIKGVRLLYGLNASDGHNLYVTCCEGPIFESFSPVVRLGGDIQNVVKYSRIVTYKGQPVKLNVVVWDATE